MRFSLDGRWAVFSAVCFSLGAMTPVGLTMGQTVNHSPLYTFNGDSGDELGFSVSGAGDVNGDGFADLIVGAPGDGNGSARVYSGIDGNVLYTFDGDGEGDFFGGSVSGAGDVNGDGFADLIVGAASDDNNGTSSGIARVFVGEGSAPQPLLGDVNTDGDVSFSDIPAFISVLLAGEFQIEADIDLNGAVNFADIGGFIAILQNQ